MKRARRASEISGQTEHVYGECRYATRKTWPWKRRIIYKAEVVRSANKEPKDNPRFVVTSLTQSPQWIYEKTYCQRGEVENRIKLRPGKLLELMFDKGGIDQTAHPIARSLRGRSGEATDRSNPSDNVPTLAEWLTMATAIGAVSSEAAEWYAIDWQAIHRNVRRLQVRIAQATKVNRWGKVRALQRLLTHSYSGKVLAVRRVTENDGKKRRGRSFPTCRLGTAAAR
jgi:hypothetical protein